METESTNESASVEPIYCKSASSSSFQNEPKLRADDDPNCYMLNSSKNSSEFQLNLSDEYDADKEEALNFHIVTNMPSISSTGNIENFSKFYQKIIQSNANRSHHSIHLKKLNANFINNNTETERKIPLKSEPMVHYCFSNHNHSTNLNRNNNTTQFRNINRLETNRKGYNSKQIDTAQLASSFKTKTNLKQHTKDSTKERFQSASKMYNLRDSSSSLSSVSSMSASETKSVERSLSLSSKVDSLSNKSSPRAPVQKVQQSTFKELVDNNDELITQLNSLTCRFKELNHEEPEQTTDYQILVEQRDRFYLSLQKTIDLFIKTNKTHEEQDSKFKEFTLISESLTNWLLKNNEKNVKKSRKNYSTKGEKNLNLKLTNKNKSDDINELKLRKVKNDSLGSKDKMNLESEENIEDSTSNNSNSIPFEFINVDDEFQNLESKLQTASSVSRSSSPPRTDSSQVINELNLKLAAMVRDYKKLENDNKILHSKLLKNKSSISKRQLKNYKVIKREDYNILIEQLKTFQRDFKIECDEKQKFIVEYGKQLNLMRNKLN